VFCVFVLFRVNCTFGGFRRFFVYFWDFSVLLGGFHFFRVLLGYHVLMGGSSLLVPMAAWLRLARLH